MAAIDYRRDDPTAISRVSLTNPRKTNEPRLAILLHSFSMSDAATRLSLHSKFLDLSQSTSEEDTPGTFTDVD